jgi:hypothetical protein
MRFRICDSLQGSLSAMVRTNRWILRISFTLVLLMAGLGLWYGSTAWQPAFEELDLSTYTNSQDWVESASLFAEQAVQLFIGATGSSQ